MRVGRSPGLASKAVKEALRRHYCFAAASIKEASRYIRLEIEIWGKVCNRAEL